MTDVLKSVLFYVLRCHVEYKASHLFFNYLQICKSIVSIPSLVFTPLYHPFAFCPL